MKPPSSPTRLPPNSPLAAYRCNRATFISRAVMGVLGAAALITPEARPTAAEHASASQNSKGKRNSKVKRWDIITIGNLSRNRYWGESDAKGVRSAICTCTVVQGEGFRLVVDPSLNNADEMAKELDRRTGLKARDITAAFITHEHGDHWFGLAHFPDAKWLAAPKVAAALNKAGGLPKPVEAATGRLFDAIDIRPTPGHTLSHHSLRFDCEGLSVVLAGDAVPTRDFWLERQGYYNSVDFELSAKTMNQLSGLADLVVPGHDNYFLNLK